jgi:hydrogenase nickel incorporation protein HypB
MTEQGLAGFGEKHYDLVFIETVGNLVCPAEFDTGATMNVCLLSVPEGDDKPLKYPLMFQVSHALVVTKIDVRSVFDFDLAKLEKNAHMRHPGMKIMPLSAKTGDGFEEWINFLREKVAEQKK